MTATTERGVLDYLDCIEVEINAETLAVVHVSDNAEERLGYELDLWRDDPSFLTETLLHEEDREPVVAILLQAPEEQRTDIEFRAVHGDGRTIILRSMLRLVRSAVDDRLRFRGILFEEREAEISMQKTEDRLELALDSANMGVWDWNIERSAIFWSDLVFRLHGVRAEDVGSTFDDYMALVERVHHDDLEEAQLRIRQALQTGDDYDIEYRFEVEPGIYRWLYVKGRIYFNDDREPIRIAGTAQDVTPRKEAEENLRELTGTLEHRVKARTAELEEANRRLKEEIAERARTERKIERINRILRQSNRELQDFAYVASHDLREPLRKISTFADLLRQDCADDLTEQGFFYVGRMQESASRMTQLIGDLLEFSRVRSRGEPFVRIDLNDVVQDVLVDLEVQIRKAEGHVDVEPLPSLEADPTQMRQLLQNLISNAMKFRRDDASPRVRISCERISQPNGEAHVHRIKVEDNGIGFEQHFAERIFSPFRRLDPTAYEGTGIGLAICKRIVERHHGTIEARGKPGEGAMFVIDLPERQPAADQ